MTMCLHQYKIHTNSDLFLRFDNALSVTLNRNEECEIGGLMRNFKTIQGLSLIEMQILNDFMLFEVPS